MVTIAYWRAQTVNQVLKKMYQSNVATAHLNTSRAATELIANNVALMFCVITLCIAFLGKMWGSAVAAAIYACAIFLSVNFHAGDYYPFGLFREEGPWWHPEVVATTSIVAVMSLAVYLRTGGATSWAAHTMRQGGQ